MTNPQLATFPKDLRHSSSSAFTISLSSSVNELTVTDQLPLFWLYFYVKIDTSRTCGLPHRVMAQVTVTEALLCIVTLWFRDLNKPDYSVR